MSHRRTDYGGRGSVQGVIPMAVLGVGSFFVGFALVFIFYRPPPVSSESPSLWRERDAGVRDAGTDSSDPFVDASVEPYAEGDAAPLHRSCSDD